MKKQKLTIDQVLANIEKERTEAHYRSALIEAVDKAAERVLKVIKIHNLNQTLN